MTLDRQVQRRVGGMQVPKARRPVSEPLDRHRAEHRLKYARVTWLDSTASHPLIADYLLKARLADRAQRQMIIKQPPQQLPPVAVKTLL